jgi:uncharacterized protein (TIGR03435 family)
MMRLTAAMVLFACLAASQSADKKAEGGKTEFEVASVKVASPPENGRTRMGFRGGPGTGDPTRLTIENYSIFQLIMRAYDLSPFQMSGVDRGGSERFNVTAKVPAGATKEQFLLMLQNLLVDRFQLKLHHETKELPIYELVVGKGGPKFKEHEGDPPKEDLDLPAAGRGIPRDKNGNLAPPPNSWIMLLPQGGGAQGRFNAVNEPMGDFAKDLSRQFGRLVVDSTGLKGRYDFLLTYSPDVPGMGGGGEAISKQGGSPGSAAPASAPDPDYGPNLIGAIQQLGLQLESKKGPVDMLVVDHCEKVPTEN